MKHSISAKPIWYAMIYLFSMIITGNASATGSNLHTYKGDSNARPVFVEGYVVHGVNVFNNKYLFDYTDASPSIPFLMPFPPTYEIGVYDPGSDNSEVITEDTDTSRLVATNSRFSQLFGLPIDTSIHNLPLGQVSSNFFGSTSATDRIVPISFQDAGEATVYHRVNTNPSPTLEEWNRIKGRISYQCKNDDTATVTVSVINAFPNAIYTMWDVGATDPLTAQEAPYGVPLGGLPNTLQTDDYGCASTTVEMPYCPKRECAPGSKSCTSYLSIAHHWDQQTYGASPALSFVGIPVGAYAGNHMVWPMSGDKLEEPHTRWSNREARRACGKRFKISNKRYYR